MQSNLVSDSLTVYLSQEEIKEKVQSLVRSQFSTYKNPSSSFHHIVNILNVSRKKKVRDCQGTGAEYSLSTVRLL